MPRGRPQNLLVHDYLTEEGLAYLTALKRKGLSDVEISKAIGACPTTLKHWKSQYKEIREAIKHGKHVADAQVENALFLSAIGHVKKVPTILKDKSSGIPVVKKKTGEIGLMTGEEGEEVIQYEDLQYFKPDVKAMIFYLTNRCFKDWRMNRTDSTEEGKSISPGVVEVIVRNEGLEELERRAIEEAKKRDEEEENRHER